MDRPNAIYPSFITFKRQWQTFRLFRFMCCAIKPHQWFRTSYRFEGVKGRGKAFPPMRKIAFPHFDIRLVYRPKEEEIKQFFSNDSFSCLFKSIAESKATCDLWHIYRNRTKIRIYRYPMFDCFFPFWLPSWCSVHHLLYNHVYSLYALLFVVVIGKMLFSTH